MRKGSDYLGGLGDGRRVWIMGEQVADVTTHPATAGVVREHARWYDRHLDPEWKERLLDAKGRPVAFQRPTTVEMFDRQMEAARAQAFASAGNITHPPQYGADIMLGAFDPVVSFGPKDRAEAVTAAYDDVLATGRFVAAPYVPTIADRFLAPQERLKPHVVAERDDGIVVSGAVGLGTALCYAEEILTAAHPGPLLPEQALWFSFPAASPGAKILCRQPSARREDPYCSPLSLNYDELDCTVYLDEVFVPWEKVYVYRDVEFCNAYLNHHVTWLVMMHMARMIARTEYSLGLALAIADSLEMTRNSGVLETVIDLIVHLETMRAAMRGAIAGGTPTPAGVISPDPLHIAAGTIYALQNRAKFADTVRTLGGFGGMLAPTLEDLEDPDVGPWVTRAYGGGRYSARQRGALLHLLQDHVASALDAREAAFEALASAGLHTWRLRVRMAFDRYEELANAVAGSLEGEGMPHIDMSFMTKFDPLTRG